MAARPGHAANVAFAKKIKAQIKKEKSKKHLHIYNPNSPPIYDTVQIMNILPHRPPMLLIDKIIELSKTHVIGVKNATMNEPFFVGHFPDAPVMPGVLQIEAMAQTGGILVLNTVPDPENYLTFFLRIDNARFKEKVLPGDTIIFRCDLMAPIRRGIAQMKGVGMVGEKVVVKATAFDSKAEGSISYVGALLGQDTRTAKARVTLANPKMAWRPGLFVNIEVVSSEAEVPVSVLTEAIQTLGDKSVVFIKVPDGFVAQPVTLGRSDGKFIEVVSGMKAGTPYAASGSFVLKSELGKGSAEHSH